jgi:2-oxoglutarate dehydrogenase E2 component (dihydrolipoamide succinyltransferase)
MGPSHTLRSENIPLPKRMEIQALTAGQAGNINSSATVTFSSASLRQLLREKGQLSGEVLPLILYELAKLLRERPEFTAFYSDNRVWFHDEVNLGVAIDLGKGLKVVTLKEADRLMPVDFAERLLDCSLRYMGNQLEAHDVTGSTFTVTDLSSENVLYFQPLVNMDQAAILGIGGDSDQEGHPMSLTLAFDHRVLTGRQASQFLNELKQRLLNYRGRT